MAGLGLSLFSLAYIYIKDLDFTYLYPIILIGGACGTWLVIRLANVRETEMVDQRTKLLAMSAAFFVLLTISVLILRFRSETYERPLSFFICLSLMAGIIAAEVPFSSRRTAPLIVGQIMILALGIAWSLTAMFPNVLGLDPWAHQWFVNRILTAESIPTNWGYSDFPIFHLLLGETRILMNVNYTAAQYPLVLAQLIVQTGLIYGISDRVFKDHRIALYSALATIMATWVMGSSVAPTPSRLGFTFVILAVFFLLMDERPRTLVMIVFLSFIIVWTHTIGALCMVILLITGLVVSRMKWNGQFSSKGFAHPAHLLFFGAVMAIWWSLAEFPLNKLAEMIEAGFSRDVFTNPASQVDYVIPMMESIFNMTGIYLFYALALIGVLFAMSKRGSLNAATISTMGLVLFGVGFVALVGQLGLLQDRWWFYSQYLLSVPLGMALYFLTNLSFKKKVAVRMSPKTLSVALVALIVVVLSFFSVMNPMSNFDNPEFSPHSGMRLAFTTSELRGASFVSSQSNATLGADYDFGVSPSSDVFYNFYRVQGGRISSIDDALVNDTWSNDGTVKVIRDWITDNPFHVSGWDYALDYDLYKSMYASDLSKIYANGGLSSYL